MLNIAVVTNLRAPYRKLQLEALSEIQGIIINVYYTNTNFLERKWDVEEIQNVNESVLPGWRIFKGRDGDVYANKFISVRKIFKNNDLILLGANIHPTNIVGMILSKCLKKPYGIIYDGISPLKIGEKENKLKMMLKKIYFKNSDILFANGTVSRRYFIEKFNINSDIIFNQKLAVDTNCIFELYNQKEDLRRSIRKKYNITENQKVVLFSGRMVKRKNLHSVIEALNLISFKEDITFLIVGDGEEKDSIQQLGVKLDVKVVITGFISDQKELFKHYLAGDIGIQPAEDEAWGLVINEEMSAGLPIIATDQCGAVLDLVKNGINGYIVQANDIDNIANSIKEIFSNNIDNRMGIESMNIISDWTVDKSKESFEELLSYAKEKKII